MDESFLEAFMAGMLVISIFGLIFSVTTAYLLWNILSKIPESNRRIEPYFAWLTLIPFVGIAIFWMLLPFKLPESLQSFFHNQTSSETDTNTDYGKLLGIMTATSYTLLFIPFINYIALFTTPTFFILYLIQVYKISKQLPPKNVKDNSKPALKDRINIAEQKEQASQSIQGFVARITKGKFKIYIPVFLLFLGMLLLLIDYFSYDLLLFDYAIFVLVVLLPYYLLITFKSTFFDKTGNIISFWILEVVVLSLIHLFFGFYSLS